MFIPEIQTGVPIPETKFKPWGQAKPVMFGLDALEVNQSAFIPISAYEGSLKPSKACKRPLDVLQNRLGSHLRTHKALKGRKFVTRQQGDGVRVWRVI